jgi:hypothetical protein
MMNSPGWGGLCMGRSSLIGDRDTALPSPNDGSSPEVSAHSLVEQNQTNRNRCRHSDEES